MKAQELRLNNWVYQYVGKNHDAELTQVYKIEEDSINGMMFQGISPVPLTEEWLLKFGFEKVNNDTYFKQYTLENQGMQIKIFNSFIVYQGFINNWNELTLIKHVHQLQNLYFALTSNELTIE